MPPATARKPLPLFWMPENNFGDALNKVLLPHFGLPAVWCDAPKAAAVGVGSILDLIPQSFAGSLLGAGFMWEHHASTFPKAEYLLVRGRLSAERCQAPASTLIGDPGLLVGRIFHPDLTVKYTLGIVPHYVDQSHPAIRAITKRYPTEIKFIDVREGVEKIVTQIAECEQIISSSLHGLIAADALGKPNKWILISSRVLGGQFKFHDYFSAFAPDNHHPRHPTILRGEESLSELLAGMHRPESHTLSLIDRIYELHAAFVNRS